MIFKSFLVINLLFVLISGSPTPSVKILGKSRSNVLFRDNTGSGDDSSNSSEEAQIKPKWKNLSHTSSAERKSKSTLNAKTCGYEVINVSCFMCATFDHIFKCLANNFSRWLSIFKFSNVRAFEDTENCENWRRDNKKR